MLVFRQSFDPQSSTYTYLLADGASGAAVIIDPVFEQVRRDAALIAELGLKLLCTLETHVHADHVTGAWLLKRRPACRIALSADSGAAGADRYLVADDVVAFGERRLQVRATPGHTGGCLTYVLDDRSMAFTGDCLLIRGSGRTDFQQGDPRRCTARCSEQIFSLPDECLLYPAHDYRGLTVTSVGEERRFNPRLGGEIGDADFTGYMENLRPRAPQEDRCRGAGQSRMRPGPRASSTSPPATGLGAAALQLCRHLGDRPARARGACARRCRSSTCASRRSSPGRSAISAARC